MEAIISIFAEIGSFLVGCIVIIISFVIVTWPLLFLFFLDWDCKKDIENYQKDYNSNPDKYTW